MPPKGARTGKFVECEYCGKIIYRTLSQYKKRIHHFCSNKCQSLKKHDETYENRKCIMCGKIYNVPKISTQELCSTNCQKEWQKTRIGKLNVRCTSKESFCDNCGKQILVKKYKIEKGQKNFCSNYCRRQWYANIFSQTQDWKNECRIRSANEIKKKKSTNTKPQIIVNKLLDDMGIAYSNEKVFEYYSMDNYMEDYNLIIEVNGDYWHSNPLKYNDYSKLYDSQKRIIPRDKAKRTYCKNHNLPILNLWESDIYENTELCKELILLFIHKNGQLDNYNSFNYEFKDNTLQVKNTIIYPYFEKHITNA